MSNLSRIKILNYKSIRELTIPLDNDYGDSRTVFLLGINESGKSNMLESLKQIGNEFEGMNFYSICHKSSQETEDTYVDIYLHMERTQEEIRSIQKEIENKFDMFKGYLVYSKEIHVNIYMTKKNTTHRVDEIGVSINDAFPLEEWIIRNGEIFMKSDTEESEPCTKEKIEDLITDFLSSKTTSQIPNVVYWKHSPEFLINKAIPLNDFKEDPSISIPLKNMFMIYGANKQEDIKNIIDVALTNNEKKSELEDLFSEKVTKHINSIWKEHKIKIKIKIDGDTLKVHVEDKDSKYRYYSMDQRSDGFKQFVSLLLTLSSEYKGGVLNDNIILLDEPETHLHPSGIKFMRDEILKIGQNNHVFVATHSPNMVDLNMLKRHWIVSKKRMETSVDFIEDKIKALDEEVLMTAFGTNMLGELLPDNLVIVEGKSDERLLNHAIEHYSKTNRPPNLSIKSAKSTAKIYPMAALLNSNNIHAFILCDADKEGRTCVEKIKTHLQENFNNANVFTLKELDNSLIPNATIEDALSKQFLSYFFKKKSLQFREDAPALSQAFSQDRKLLENKDKFKKELVDAYIESTLETEGHLLTIVQNLMQHISK